MSKRDPLYRPLPDSFELPPLPPPEAPPKDRRSWVATVAAAAGVVATFYGLIRLVPQFGEIYSQVHVDLPASTALLLGASRAVCSWPVPFLALGLLYPWWAGRPSPSATGRAARTLAAIAIVLCWLWMAWALFEPLVGVTSIGSHKR